MLKLYKLNGETLFGWAGRGECCGLGGMDLHRQVWTAVVMHFLAMLLILVLFVCLVACGSVSTKCFSGPK